MLRNALEIYYYCRVSFFNRTSLCLGVGRGVQLCFKFVTTNNTNFTKNILNGCVDIFKIDFSYNKTGFVLIT